MSSPPLDPQAEAVAIIGMAGRFPGARDLSAFRDNLLAGRESIRFFTNDELHAAGFDAATWSLPNFVAAHGFLDAIDLFDAGFFGYSPADAQVLDPQLRLFLECAWEGLETAACDPQTYQGAIGVFGGCTTSAYVNNLYASGRPSNHMQWALSTDKDHLATHVSYRLNLRGPSMAIQTACSTSLVATALACQSLLDYQCDVAIAGGSSIGVPQARGYVFEEGGIFSPDGHCCAFDAKARGTVGGSGVGIVVLKRLSEALANRDPILAVIRGWATNNDGAQKVGYTAPSVEGQASVIALAHAIAGVSADSLQYVETHGTGTALGDPVEVAALTQAFRATTDRVGYCAIGSVKTNIGHLDAAAGIAGLIKTVLAMRARTIPPSLNFERPNPLIDFASSPFFVPSTAIEWPAPGGPRRAGVSAFGIGGTNAHLVLEEAPPVEPSGPSRKWQLLLQSARTQAAVESTSDNLAAFLSQHPELPIADVAYTTQVGRAAFAKRRVVLCEDSEDALRALTTRDPLALLNGTHARDTRSVAFLFPGQGAQHLDMMRGLYESESRFRDEVDGCAQKLLPVLGLDLRHQLYPSAALRERAREQLTRTSVAQPALFVLEYALARLWIAWGVTADCMIGHSVGEYVAACLAGVFTLDDALWLVAHRGLLMEQAEPGAMLVVPRSEADLHPLLDDDIALAAVNGPASCVLSGSHAAIDRVANLLAADGLRCHRLRTSHAFHSALMDPILAPFVDAVRMVPAQPPQLPFVSNLTGDWISAAEATDPEYWSAHLRHTVRFSTGLMRLLEQPDRVLLEVGPGTTLSSLARMHARRTPTTERQGLVISSARHPEDAQDDGRALMTAAGRLWLAGVSPDWTAMHAREQRARIALPTYPFERERYWIDPDPAPPPIATMTTARANLPDWFSVPSWRPALPREWLTDVAATVEPRRWLLFADALGLSAQLRDALERDGHSVSVIEIGEEFERRAGGYAIRAAERDDYEAMLDDLVRGVGLPDGVLHTLCLTATFGEGDDLARLKEVGFHSLLCLAQALGSRDPERICDIAVVSNYVVRMPDHDTPVCPAKALAIGPVRVIPQEYSGLRCRLVDVDLPAADADRVARLIIDEVLLEPFHPIVAYRQQRRWIESIEPVRLPEPVDAPPTRLRPGGVYLVTGGFGGIGSVLSQYIAEQVPAKFVLLGRTGMPPKSQWVDLLAAGGNRDRTASQVSAVLQLESTGAEVLPLAIDITDPEQARAAVRQTVERFGTINGVIHAAGVPGDGIIELKTRTVADRVLAPKVEGTLALHAAVAGRSLDFFVICSSLASLVGAAGQVDYCAANNFEDAFARCHAADPPVQAINWDSWQLLGMAMDASLPADLDDWRAIVLQHAIRPDEGARVFDLVLRTRLPQLAVCTTDLASMMRGTDWQLADDHSLPTADAPAVDMHSRPDLPSDFVSPVTETEHTVAGLWQTLLGIAPIGRDDSFFDLGGHSLLAIQLVSRLKEAYEMSMTVRDVFERPTVRQLAEWLDLHSQRQADDTSDLSLLLAEVEKLPE